MSTLLIDLKYVGFISPRLRNFKRNKAQLFVFSHSCEDNNSSKQKTRCYIYKKGSGMNVYCHHCGYSRKFSNFLRDEDPTLYGEYRLEIFKENSGNQLQTIPDPTTTPTLPNIETFKQKLDDDIILISDLSEKHPARQYVVNRKIPYEFFDRIGVVSDFNRFASQYDDSFKNKTSSVPRLILPLYDETGKEVLSYSGRAFGREKPKYLNITVKPDVEKIYGLWRIVPDKPILVVEGQIDSLFLDNCVAISGANYTGDFLKRNKDRVIIVPDSDFKRNDQVFNALKKAISEGYRISFLPKKDGAKDVNDLVKKYNFSSEELSGMIVNTAKSGIDATVELIFQRKNK